MFKAIRTVYFENNKRKVTTKKYETYKQAKAYAKRYSKLVNGARFVEVEIKFDTDSFKFKNVDIFVADSNGFENEHLEEIEKFQKETEENKTTKRDAEYLVKGNNDYEYETTNLKEAGTYVIVEQSTLKANEFSDITEKAAIEMAEDWAREDNETYKIYKRIPNKGLADGFVKAVNWHSHYEVLSVSGNNRKQFPTFEAAKDYAEDCAKNDVHDYKIFSTYLSGRGLVKYKLEATIKSYFEGYQVSRFGCRPINYMFKTLADAKEYAERLVEKDGVIYIISVKRGSTVQEVKRIEPQEKAEIHYELEINEYNEAGYMEKENEAKFKTLEEATACADELIKNAGENEIVLRLYKVTGDDFECLFTKHASGIHGLVAIAEDKPEQTVAETQAEYTADNITDSELISMLVKEPVNASLYDFMREPQKIKISKKGRKRLNAVREIVKRALVALPEEKTMIGTVEDAANLMMKRLRYKNKECFYAIILDTKNKVVNISKITEGYLNGSIVHPTDVFKEILRYETACSVIFCHNHPSGDPTPSTEDINITFCLVKAGKVLDIEVLDHIIIGDGIYKSFKQAGLFSNNATSLPWLECEGR